MKEKRSLMKCRIISPAELLILQGLLFLINIIFNLKYHKVLYRLPMDIFLLPEEGNRLLSSLRLRR